MILQKTLKRAFLGFVVFFAITTGVILAATINDAKNQYLQSTQPAKNTVHVTTTTPTTYSAELYGAYDYAYGIGITTQTSIQNADMYGKLIRSHMAKMMVNYAKEVLGRIPDTSKYCYFSDIYNQTVELQGYIQEACQMGLMGVGLTQFNPNSKVTRAEFGTVLSRALYGSAYDGGNPYYTKHLSALNKASIMNDISAPWSLEKRGYVMLMLKRSGGGSSGGGDNSEICETPENVLSCSLELDTCPTECGGSTYFSGKIVGSTYELSIPRGTWKRTYNGTDTDYEYWNGNILIQIRSEKYTTYNDSTLEDMVQDQISSDKTRFRNYKQLENTTETIGGKTFGLIKFQAKPHDSTVTGSFLGFEKIYKDGDSYVYLYISTFSDSEQSTINSILDSLKITNSSKNCNPNTEHKDGSLCVSNTKTCSTNNGEGSQTWNGISRGTCEISSCDYGFVMQYGSCVSDTQSCYIYHGTGEKKLVDGIWGACTVVSCNNGYVQNENACYPTQTRSCTIANGVGTQTGVNNIYGTCTVVSCNNGYVQNGNACSLYIPTCTSEQHLENNQCVVNTRTCNITNGSGQQNWNGNSWGSCIVSSCNTGYIQSGSACRQITTRSCTITNGQGIQTGTRPSSSVSYTYSSCAVVSCNTNYSIVGNQCLLVTTRSCTITNGVGIETGSRSSTSFSWSWWGVCNLVSCNVGYAPQGNTCIVLVPTCTNEQHLENNMCVSNTMNCNITNGMGQQTRNGSSRNTCLIISCNSGYVLSGDICM